MWGGSPTRSSSRGWGRESSWMGVSPEALCPKFLFPQCFHLQPPHPHIRSLVHSFIPFMLIELTKPGEC